MLASAIRWSDGAQLAAVQPAVVSMASARSMKLGAGAGVVNAASAMHTAVGLRPKATQPRTGRAGKASVAGAGAGSGEAGLNVRKTAR